MTRHIIMSYEPDWETLRNHEDLKKRLRELGEWADGKHDLATDAFADAIKDVVGWVFQHADLEVTQRED